MEGSRLAGTDSSAAVVGTFSPSLARNHLEESEKLVWHGVLPISFVIVRGFGK